MKFHVDMIKLATRLPVWCGAAVMLGTRLAMPHRTGVVSPKMGVKSSSMPGDHPIHNRFLCGIKNEFIGIKSHFANPTIV